LVAGAIIIFSGGGDDTADPPPSGSTGPVSDTDPSDTGAPPSTSAGNPAGLERVVANLQAMAAAEIDDCPIGDDVFDTISADAEGPLIAQAIEGGIVDVGVAQPDPSGASMVQCSAGSSDGGVGLFVGTLGDLEVGAWIGEHVGAQVELAEAQPPDPAETTVPDTTGPDSRRRRHLTRRQPSWVLRGPRGWARTKSSRARSSQTR
jgi:hypothetical protein